MGDPNRSTSASAGNASRTHASGSLLSKALALNDDSISQVTGPIRLIRAFYVTINAAVEVATIGASCLAVMSGALGILGFGTAAWGQLKIPFDAMNVGRNQISRIAAAHTYAYWLFSHLDPHCPNHRPHALRNFQRAEDRMGNYDAVSTERWATIWYQSFTTTLRALNNNYENVQISHIRAQLMDFMPNANVHNFPEDECRQTLKVLTCSNYGHDPKVAALAYLLWQAKDLSRIERETLAIVYRQYPYAE